VPRLKFKELENEDKNAETSLSIRERVEKARQIQLGRFSQLKIFTNSEMGAEEINNFCALGEEEKQILRLAVNNWHLSPRAYYRLIKVGRTIADLSNSPLITAIHLAEALQYRAKTEN